MTRATMDLAEKYVVWDGSSSKGSFISDEEEASGIKAFDWNKDIPLAKRWPKDAHCVVEGGNPNKPQLDDSVSNTSRIRIISERLKNALEAHEVTDVEYLPVEMRDGTRPLGGSFFFLNFLHAPDCLDLEASKARMWPHDKSSVDKIERLVLKSDPDRALFKLANYKDVVIVRMDLAESLSEIGFSGIQWLPLFNHPHFDWKKDKSPIWIKVRALTEQIYKNGKPIKLGPDKRAAKPKLVKVPRELGAWLKGLGDGLIVESESFVPAPGDDVWLDSYDDDRESWPAFDPKRYHAIGTNDQGNYWLLDLGDEASIVYYSHEEGYAPNRNFSKVAPNLAAFQKMVMVTRRA